MGEIQAWQWVLPGEANHWSQLLLKADAIKAITRDNPFKSNSAIYKVKLFWSPIYMNTILNKINCLTLSCHRPTVNQMGFQEIDDDKNRYEAKVKQIHFIMSIKRKSSQNAYYTYTISL